MASEDQPRMRPAKRIIATCFRPRYTLWRVWRGKCTCQLQLLLPASYAYAPGDALTFDLELKRLWYVADDGDIVYGKQA